MNIDLPMLNPLCWQKMRLFFAVSFALALLHLPSSFAQIPASSVGPMPLENPQALHQWGNRVRDQEGCTLAESAWMRVVEDSPESEWAPPSYYNMAVCQEFDMNWEAAIRLYDQLIDNYPNDPLQKDAQFRKGLVLEEMGAYRQAFKLFKGICRDLSLKLSPTDKLACQIQQDINRLKKGRKNRGTKALLQHLDDFDTMERDTQDALRYWIARVELSLGQVLSQHARTLPLVLTPIGKIRSIFPWNDETEMIGQQLNERGQDLLAAQARYQKTIDHQQPTWTLAAIYSMGRDYELLYRDMVDAPSPKGLSPEVEEQYRFAVEAKAYPILVKAYKLYVHGDMLSRSFDKKTHYNLLISQRLRALDLEGVTSEIPFSN